MLQLRKREMMIQVINYNNEEGTVLVFIRMESNHCDIQSTDDTDSGKTQ